MNEAGSTICNGSDTRDGRRRSTAKPLIVMQFANMLLAFCDMKTLYLRNVPDDVGERLGRLAAREGLSVSTFVTRQLAIIARRADNPALLADLPDLAITPESVVSALETGRTER